jgi:hypothetical protein
MIFSVTAGVFPHRGRLVDHIASRAPCVTLKFESSHPGRSDSNFHGQRVDSTASSCTAAMLERRPRGRRGNEERSDDHKTAIQRITVEDLNAQRRRFRLGLGRVSTALAVRRGRSEQAVGCVSDCLGGKVLPERVQRLCGIGLRRPFCRADTNGCGFGGSFTSSVGLFSARHLAVIFLLSAALCERCPAAHAAHVRFAVALARPDKKIMYGRTDIPRMCDKWRLI